MEITVGDENTGGNGDNVEGRDAEDNPQCENDTRQWAGVRCLNF